MCVQLLKPKLRPAPPNGIICTTSAQGKLLILISVGHKSVILVKRICFAILCSLGGQVTCRERERDRERQRDRVGWEREGKRQVEDRERERVLRSPSMFCIGNLLLQIFALEGFVKACQVGLTDSYNNNKKSLVFSVCVCVCVLCVVCVCETTWKHEKIKPTKSRLVIEREGVGWWGWVGVNAGCIGCNPSLRYVTHTKTLTVIEPNDRVSRWAKGLRA